MSSTAVLLLLLMQAPPASQSNGSAADPSQAPGADHTGAGERRARRSAGLPLAYPAGALAPRPPQASRAVRCATAGRVSASTSRARDRHPDAARKEALRGAVPYGGMTHQEFLDLVTPDDVRGYAAFSNAEGITVAATSIALQWAVLKAMDALKKAKDMREQEAARNEVEAGARSPEEGAPRRGPARKVAPARYFFPPSTVRSRRSSAARRSRAARAPPRSAGTNPRCARRCSGTSAPSDEPSR